MKQELVKLFYTRNFWLRYFWSLQDDFLDVFSNEPLLISLARAIAFGYCLEGPTLDSGLYFVLRLTKIQEGLQQSLLFWEH